MSNLQRGVTLNLGKILYTSLINFKKLIRKNLSFRNPQKLKQHRNG